jgi:opacity protein-like surface antigen
VPFGGSDSSLRPFVSGGVGLVRPKVAEAGGLAAIDENKFGWNIGGGATGFLNDRVGITGDVRYFRTMAGDDDDPNAFGIDFDAFEFWRASAGVTFKW